MSYELYKIIHSISLFALVSGVTLMLTVKKRENPDPHLKKGAGVLHGIGLLISIISGVGLAHKSGVGFPPWVFLKILFWLCLGLTPIITKRLSGIASLLIVLTIAATAISIAVVKPTL